MSGIQQYFQPPLYWQQFEDLTGGVFSQVYRDPKPTKFGRPGQAQNGVDVYGYENGNGRLIGIQCKRMDERDTNNHPLPGGVITEKIINNEILAVRGGFPKPLDTWILATTAKRDAKIQRYALKLDEESRRANSFGIQLWFWDDFITDINRYHDLQKWYYEHVIQVRSSDDQDEIILEVLGEAFSRAAFRMPIHLETPLEFIQALKDTQHAISTGELKDRESRRVIRKAIGGRRAIASKKVSAHLRKADEALHLLRKEYEQNLRKNIIQQPVGMVQIPQALQTSLTNHRENAIKAINAALLQAGLSII